METTVFYWLGKAIYKLRWYIVFIWLTLILSCLPFFSSIMSPFATTGFTNLNSPSALSEKYLNEKIGYQKNRFIVTYTLIHPKHNESINIQQIKQSLSGLQHFHIPHEIIYPDKNRQVSADKKSAHAIILFKGQTLFHQDLLDQFKSLITIPHKMTILFGGEALFIDDINKQTQKDLYKADLIAAPVSIAILVFVFGSVVASLAPVLLGGTSAILILTMLYFIAHSTTLSIFTINIALLLGLCLSLDYSLFIISRYREEIHHSKNNMPPAAIAITLATAGKAVFFSGLAVFISMSALLFFPINILFSVGVGGLIAVFMSVLTATILLPAILSILHKRIDLLSVRRFKKETAHGHPFWRLITSNVIKRPLYYFVSILLVLLLLSYPFLNVKIGIADFHLLPKKSESRLFFDTYNMNFNQNELSPIFLIVTAKHDNILSKHNISKLYDLTIQLKDNPLIEKVNSIVTLDPHFSKQQYQMLYQSPKHIATIDIKTLLKTTTIKNATVMTIISKYPANSLETKTLVQQLQSLTLGKDMELKLTGASVNNIEVIDTIVTLLPYALAWIIVLTYLILVLLLRSLFLPFKAIMMNILSLTASYGVLVFIFQEGHLHQLLHFEPQGMLDISLLVIIFCALFGFSMDYEVFLLTRIKEFYDKTKDNNKSIVLGVAQSSGIITSAALIVIFLCASFMVADVLMVKAFGLGIAVAIFVDAFLIRSILVPATMALVKQLNWYLPKWLEDILPK